MSKLRSGVALSPIAELHRTWLRRLPQLTGKSRSRIAEELGIARTTLTNPLKATDPGTSTLHAGTIEKIVKAYGVPAPDALGGATAGFAEEAAAFDHAAASPLAAAVRALIGNRDHVMPVALQTRALEGAGYLPGDILVYDLNRAPQPGDVARAQVYDRNGEIIETVWRVYDPPFLTGSARDAAAQPKPLIVDSVTVVLMGSIIGMIRPGNFLFT